MKKTQKDPISVDSGIRVLKFDHKMSKLQIVHLHDTRSKNKAAPVSSNSMETEVQGELRGGLGVGQ